MTSFSGLGQGDFLAVQPRDGRGEGAKMLKAGAMDASGSHDANRQYYDAFSEGYEENRGDNDPGGYHDLLDELEADFVARFGAGRDVLEVGCGTGLVLSRVAGFARHAKGVDLSPGMLEKARANAAKVGITNTEFRLGEIEHLPVADASVDVIISNCVVNLSPEKPQVFREAFRVLKSGGRLMLSDLVLTKPLSPEMQNDVSLYVGCVAGASLETDYLRMISEAGFAKVEVQARGRYEVRLTVIAEPPSVVSVIAVPLTCLTVGTHAATRFALEICLARKGYGGMTTRLSVELRVSIATLADAPRLPEP